MLKTFLYLLWLPLLAQNATGPSPEVRAQMEEQAAALQAMLQKTPKSPFSQEALRVTPPQGGWKMGMVSWVTSDKNGLIYLLQRGDKADPVVVVNKDGKVVRSWGKGMYTMPHAIRVDPQGSVWTTDAASSMVYKFSSDGKKL